MPVPTQQKAEKIDELTDKLGRAVVAILVQTQGLNVKDMTELRNKMRAAKLEFLVAKNTLLRIATERNNMTELDKSIFNGQTAVALGYDDEVAAAKVVTDYVQSSKIVVLKSGILGGRTLTANQENALIGHAIERRGPDPFTTVSAGVAIAPIVGDGEEDVGTRWLARPDRER